MKIAIIGAGAMGCLIASYLCTHHEIWLVDPWQTQVDTINSLGLTRERESHVSVCYPHATMNPHDVADADVAIVLVKYHQTPWAAEQVAAALRADGLCVTLQNGIGGADVLAHHLGTTPVTRGVTSLGATLVKPGHVRHAGMGDTVFSHVTAPDVIDTLIQAFNDAGLPAHASSNLDEIVWGKLIVNVAINALTGILRVPNGIIAEHTGAMAIAHAAVQEAIHVAQAHGISLPYDDAFSHAMSVARATAGNRSSTLQDVMRGSPSEIMTINGAVVAYAEQKGIPVPVNRLLVEFMNIIDTTAAVRIT